MIRFARLQRRREGTREESIWTIVPSEERLYREVSKGMSTMTYDDEDGERRRGRGVWVLADRDTLDLAVRQRMFERAWRGAKGRSREEETMRYHVRSDMADVISETLRQQLVDQFAIANAEGSCEVRTNVSSDLEGPSNDDRRVHLVVCGATDSDENGEGKQWPSQNNRISRPVWATCCPSVLRDASLWTGMNDEQDAPVVCVTSRSRAEEIYHCLLRTPVSL